MKKFLILILLFISSFTYSQSAIFSYSKTVIEHPYDVPIWHPALTSIILSKDVITFNESGIVSRFYIININSYNPIIFETLFNNLTFTITLEPDKIVIKNGRVQSQIMFKVDNYY